MTQIRIITDNASDRGTISVPNTAPGMGADKLKTDIKGEVCRVLSSSFSITVTWPSAEAVGAVVIPASNLGPSSTIRIRAYLEENSTTPIADSGIQFAAPGSILANWDFSQILNANIIPDGSDWDFNQPVNTNLFSEGQSPVISCYLPERVPARKVVIDIEDPGNTFVDISRLVIGSYHAPQYGADYGASISTTDMTQNTRTASGDIKSEWGPKNSSMEFNLGWIANEDRERIRQIISRGIGKFIFVSLLPNNEDPVLERDYSIYGKLSQPGSLVFSKFNLHSSSFQIEGF